MVKAISILGSTGSIGTQCLDVLSHMKNVRVLGLSTNKRIELLEKQIREFKPQIAAVMDEEKAAELTIRVADTQTKIVSGMDGLIAVAVIAEVEMLVTSVVGMIGLIPTMAAIEAGKHIALANKETLVTAGALVMEAARRKGVKILPVDSEHSAIFQCLEGNTRHSQINKLIITASGGPFRGKKRDALTEITPAQALKHPKWNMGSKISIDSATMMNKGLEVIEAKWLFGMDLDKIQVVVHPESIIHSMVEFTDCSILAQLGLPDMRLPIQYALTYPDRMESPCTPMDFLTHNSLHFEDTDVETFSCLALAYRAATVGGTMPTVLNAVNEVAVDAFLNEKIGFLDIAKHIERVMDAHQVVQSPTLEQILQVDAWAREMFLQS